MTKSWDEVRELICRLYLVEGKSLANTRRLLAQRGFIASDRAYRMKLKEWGLKRDDLNIEETGPGGRWQTSRFSTFDSPAEDSVLEDLYNQIKQQRTIQDAYPLLEQSEHIINQLLLYSAARVDRDGSAAEHMVHYLVMTGFRFENAALGKAALEIAIREGNVDFVNIILAAGASIDFGVLLHNRPPRAAELGVLMLANGLRIDEQTLYEFEDSDLQTKILTQFQGWEIDPKVLGYCLVSCQRSFGRGSQFSTPLGSAYKDFIKSWCFSDIHHPVFSKLSSNCLTVFLAMGCDPFIEVNAGLHCPSGRCKTLAALILSHSTSPEYRRVIIERPADRYVQDVAQCILQPCPDRVQIIREQPLRGLLSCLLSRSDVQWNENHLTCCLIRGCSNEDPEKANLLTAIMEAGTNVTNLNDARRTCPFGLLKSTPEPLCWELAEILLSNRTTANKPNHHHGEDFTGLQAAQYLVNLDQGSSWLSAYLQECEQTSQHFLKLSKVKREDPQIRKFFVHVWTKRLIDHDSLSLTPKQLRDILLLRKESSLPSVPISSHYLIRFLDDKSTQ